MNYHVAYETLRALVTSCCKIIAEVVFPSRCPICDDLLQELPKDAIRICPECLPKVTFIQEPICKRCGKPVDDETKEFCMDCRLKKHYFLAGRAVMLYKGETKVALYRFKYSERRAYAEIFAEEAVRRYGDWVKRQGITLIVPVPMYHKKKRKRGYNQAEDFAVELGKLLQIPVERKLVRRVQDTKPMKGLQMQERTANVKNAFHITKNHVKYNNRILVVDDIYTTGSTVDAISLALQRAGYSTVYFLSICTGEDG